MSNAEDTAKGQDGRRARHNERNLNRVFIALWLLALAFNVVGISQIFRAERDFRFITDTIVPLSNNVLSLLKTHLEISVAGEQAVQLMRLSVSDPEAKQQLDDLKPVILRKLDLQRDSIHAVDSALLGLAQSYGGQSSVRRLRSVFQNLEEEHKMFAASLEASLSTQSTGVETREMVRLARALFDQNSAELSENLASMVTSTVERREEQKFLLLLEMGFASFAFLVLGGVLFLKISRMQQALVMSEKKLLLGEMAVTLQHEINNPLAVIVSNSFLVAKDSLSPEARKSSCGAIDEAAQRINSVVQRMSELKTIETVEYLRGVQMLKLDPELPTATSSMVSDKQPV